MKLEDIALEHSLTYKDSNLKKYYSLELTKKTKIFHEKDQIHFISFLFNYNLLIGSKEAKIKKNKRGVPKIRNSGPELNKWLLKFFCNINV